MAFRLDGRRFAPWGDGRYERMERGIDGRAPVFQRALASAAGQPDVSLRLPRIEMVTENSVQAWPEERAAEREGSDRMAAYLARARAEVLDAMALRRPDMQALAAMKEWLRVGMETGRRLPQRDTIDSEVAKALRTASVAAVGFDGLDRPPPANGTDESVETAVLLALSTVALLQETPDEGHWKILIGLYHRGHRLEAAIEEALGRALREKPDLRENLIVLARRMVDRASADPTGALISSDRDMFAAMIGDWKRKPDLLELWFGLRGFSYVRYDGSEVGVLREIAKFDVRAFVSLLERFDNPYPVWASIEATDAAFRFETWRSFVDAAPLAFADDGAWNGSTILPIVLVVAGDALARTAVDLWREEDETVLQTAAADLRRSIEDVVAVVMQRADGPAALLRWGAWSARALASRPDDGRAIPKNLRDRSFVPLQILSVMGDALGPGVWAGMSPNDLKSPEAWFAIMARIMATPQSMANLEGHRRLLADFMSWWPDDDLYQTWRSENGIRLRDAASAFGNLISRPGGIASRILSIPMGMVEDPSASWFDLWSRCRLLREEVEYARRDTYDDGESEIVRSASDLLRIVVDLGLCVLDQAVDERIELSCDREEATDGLVTYLWGAASEMLFVDRFGLDWWNDLRRHLVLRRFLYFEGAPARAHTRRSTGLKAPALSDMLCDAASVDRQFISMLLDLMNHGMPIDVLRFTLVNAKVDPTELVNAVEGVNAVDDRRPICTLDELLQLRRLT